MKKTRKFIVAIQGAEGGVEYHPMKDWLRRNPSELPAGLDPYANTSHQLRNGLRKLGWTVRQGEDEVHLVKPGSGSTASAETLPALDSSERASPVREREWVHRLVPRLQASLQTSNPNLEVRDGYRLAYSREILSYDGDVAQDEAGMRYETDLLIVERAGTRWTPRVVVEAKLGTVTTHDAITYSQKAATHKQVHPYLRYGIFLGGRKHHPLPGRLFRHGAHFDFMLSWKGLEPTHEEFGVLIRLLEDEVAASRLLQEIMFNSRARDRASYSVLQKPIIAR